MHSPEFKLRSGPVHSLSPALTCAGRVLKAAPLPEWGEELVFRPSDISRGQVGGHFPGLCGSDCFRWVKESWVSHSCGGWSVADLQSVRGGGEKMRWMTYRREKVRCSTDAGSLESFCIQCKYVCVCVLRACEQGFPDWLVQHGAAEHPSAAKQAPPPPKDSPRPELQRWRKMRAWWRGSASPLPRTNTHTEYNTHSSSLRVCCCHDNHNLMCGQTTEEQSCWELQISVTKILFM